MNKPRIFNGIQWVEFDTQEEHDAAVALLSPTNPAIVAAYLLQEKAEIIGKALVRDLNKDMDEMNLTEAQELDLTNRLIAVLMYLGDGMLGRARKVLNAMTVAGQLTLARKNFILNKIDAAIAQL